MLVSKTLMMQEAGQTRGQWRPEAEAGGREVRGWRLCGGWSGPGDRQTQPRLIIQEECQWPGQESQSEGHQGKQRYEDNQRFLARGRGRASKKDYYVDKNFSIAL